MKPPSRLLFLASGRGSNFGAVCDAIAQGEIPGAKAIGLICNKPQAPVLALAKDRNIPASLISDREFRRDGKWDRAAYEDKLAAEIRKFSPDLICLAGYMLLLGKPILETWAGKIVNIHPSLLPAFKGLHAQKQAVDSGARRTGCTVHFVTHDLDSGPVIAQSTVEVRADDTEESLTQRLLPIEHQTYIRALQLLCSGKQGLN